MQPRRLAAAGAVGHRRRDGRGGAAPRRARRRAGGPRPGPPLRRRHPGRQQRRPRQEVLLRGLTHPGVPRTCSRRRFSSRKSTFRAGTRGGVGGRQRRAHKLGRVSAPNKSLRPGRGAPTCRRRRSTGATAEALRAIAAAADLDALKAARLAHAGDRSPLALANREIGALPPQAKAEAGKRVGQARGAASGLRSRPGRPSSRPSATPASWSRRPSTSRCRTTARPRGARHPLTTHAGADRDVFVAMGYEVAEGPEVEAEWLNFDALNLGPTTRRARCRTPSSSSSRGLRRWSCARTPRRCRSARCSTRPLPVYVDLPRPGLPHRRARRDAHARSSTRSRASSSTRASPMADLKGTLDHFAPAMFGDGTRTRLRPVLLPVHRADRRGRHAVLRVPRRRRQPGARAAPASEGWIEWGGCGMVNPRVLVACGVDPERYSGFAFGMGIERTLMFRHDVDGHARHGRGRRPVHPAVRDRRSDARPAVLAAGVRRPARRRHRVATSPTQLVARRPRGREPSRRSAPASPARSSSAGCSTIEELTEFKKPIRFCQVDVGERTAPDSRSGIVCGARNFAVGDMVVVALPGAVLPGGFAIAARKTYGHVSDGMICSERELGMGDDHAGIIVLPPGTRRARRRRRSSCSACVDEVLDIAVTPDRGYCLSMRGVAREAATAYGAAAPRPGRRSTAARRRPARGLPGARSTTRPAATASRCATVTGLDPEAPTPLWLRRRLDAAGMRPISLAVDVTNYVMLELGQPLHAFDRGKLHRADRAYAGRERARSSRPSTTSSATLDPEDLVITDDSRPDRPGRRHGRARHRDRRRRRPTSCIEAAHFDAADDRAHGAPAQAVQRGVASASSAASTRRSRRTPRPRAAALLLELGGGTVDAGHDRGRAPACAAPAIAIRCRPPGPGRRASTYGRDDVVPPARRRSAARSTADGTTARRSPPPSLAARPHRPERPGRGGHSGSSGYDEHPVGAAARARRAAGSPTGSGCAAASAGRSPAVGYVEVLQLPVRRRGRRSTRSACRPTTPRRRLLRAGQPALRRGSRGCARRCCRGCCATLRRNVGRGCARRRAVRDRRWCSCRATASPSAASPTRRAVGAADRPTRELAGLEAAAARPAACTSPPCSPARASRPAGGARAARRDWADAVEAARARGRAPGRELVVRAGPARAVAPGPLRRARRRRASARRPRR